jgi:hypothetical protein
MSDNTHGSGFTTGGNRSSKGSRLNVIFESDGSFMGISF